MNPPRKDGLVPSFTTLIAGCLRPGSPGRSASTVEKTMSNERILYGFRRCRHGRASDIKRRDRRTPSRRANRCMARPQPLVVFVDYPGRRPEAHLSELGLERAGYRICELLRHPLPPASRLAAYASALLAREPVCAEATAVVAYCAAAPLAARVASQLWEATGAALPVIFLDPSQCDVQHILNAYATVVQQIEMGLDAAERRPPLEVRDGLHDPVNLGKALSADIHDRVCGALAASGFSEQECQAAKGQGAALYVDWLHYLLAVHHRGEASQVGPVLNLISAAHSDDAAWLGVNAGETLRVECTRANLARRAETFDRVVEFLAVTTTSVPKGRP